MRKPNLKVKTTHVGCCKIEDNTEYLAYSEYPETASYVSVLLPNGEWTSDHHNMDRFKVIERYGQSQQD